MNCIDSENHFVIKFDMVYPEPCDCPLQDEEAGSGDKREEEEIENLNANFDTADHEKRGCSDINLSSAKRNRN